MRNQLRSLASFESFFRRTSERWHPLPGAPRRNRVNGSSKEGHVDSRRGSGLLSRVLFAAFMSLSVY